MTKDTRRTFGTTRLERSGRHSARYSFEGRQVSVPGTFPTKKAAEARLAEIQTELGKGAHVDPAKAAGTLGEWWQEYSATKTDWQATTRQNREDVWRLYIEPKFGKTPLSKISSTGVKSWYATLHKTGPSSADGAYRLLRQLLNAAIDETPPRLVVNPCKIRGAGVDRAPERRVATLAEVEAIFSEIPERMRLLVLLATYTGLRRSELLGLRRSDVDVAHLTVSVAQTVHHLKDGQVVTQGTKTAASRRKVAFPSSIAADVEDHLARYVVGGRDALVFTGEKGGPLLPHLFGREFRRARNLAGRPDLTLHDLRHTSLTLAAATGATLAELMHRAGHSTPHAALRYQHASEDRDRVISEALAPLRPTAPVIDLAERRRAE